MLAVQPLAAALTHGAYAAVEIPLYVDSQTEPSQINIAFLGAVNV